MEMSPCFDSSRIRLTLVPKLYHRLSMQQLIDCDMTDLGCGGGLMDQAFAYDEDAVGLCALSEYPFAYHRHWFYGCSRYMPYCTPLNDTRVRKFVDVNKTEADLVAAIATQPVSVAVVAADDWQFYSGGIYDGGCANPDAIDHGERDGVGEVGCWLTITFRLALKMRIILLNSNYHIWANISCAFAIAPVPNRRHPRRRLRALRSQRRSRCRGQRRWGGLLVGQEQLGRGLGVGRM